MYGRRRYRSGGYNSAQNGIGMPDDRDDVARKIADVMSRQKHGRERPTFAQRSGRIDRRSLARVKAGYDRPFSRRNGESPTALRVAVILDLSGSMMGKRVNDAVQMGWDFAMATRYMPQVHLEVWGHGTAYVGAEKTKAHEMNKDGTSGVREGDVVMAYHLWEKGMTKRQYKAQLRNVRLCGNEDGFALQAIAKDVMDRAKSNEKVLVIMVSDGTPIYTEMSSAYGHVRGVVNSIRRKGAAVVSVSIASGLRKDQQTNMYGTDVIEYDEDMRKTAASMARVMGRALS